jgi:prepilin-type N-terminal cleavage/methylation domain-containing protein
MADPRENGFTLLEILVAMVIFSITLTTLYATFRSFLTSADLVTRDIHEQEQFRMGIQAMRADLELIILPQPPRYHPPGFNEDPDIFRFAAEETSVSGSFFSQLQFVSLNHLETGPGAIPGAARIHYYVHRHGNRFDLHRSDRALFSEEEPNPCTNPVLVKNIHTFSLTFTDSRGTEHKTWDSDADTFEFTIPAQVIIDIQTTGEDDAGHQIRTAVFLPVSRKVEK